MKKLLAIVLFVSTVTFCREVSEDEDYPYHEILQDNVNNPDFLAGEDYY